jgi:hypothetical protein
VLEFVLVFRGRLLSLLSKDGGMGGSLGPDNNERLAREIEDRLVEVGRDALGGEVESIDRSEAIELVELLVDALGRRTWGGGLTSGIWTLVCMEIGGGGMGKMLRLCRPFCRCPCAGGEAIGAVIGGPIELNFKLLGGETDRPLAPEDATGIKIGAVCPE